MQKPDLKTIPSSFGVYLFKDSRGKVLYVGKAKNLRARLRNYFDKQVSPKTKILVEKASKVETQLASNEIEALLLESNLIKEYRPPFNVVLRDDKNYLYIKISILDDFPKIQLVRQIARDGAKYFGPFVDAKALRNTIRLVHRIFPLCTSTSSKIGRACLNYHLGICPGVCLGKADKKEYHQTIGEVIRFLGGDYAKVLLDLRSWMKASAAARQFERAARLRDAIAAVERISDRQQAVSPNLKLDQDVIGLARELNKTVIVLMQVRFGKLLNQQLFVMESKYESGDEEILAGFLRDYYRSAPEVPKEILVPEKISDVKIFERWLGTLTRRKVKILSPQRGRNRQLVRLAASNAKARFSELASRWNLESRIANEGVMKLKRLLKIKVLNRIEAYDISNLQGTDSVGAMVVWEKGQLDKKQYRRFRIRRVLGPNDFASLAEVLQRRFAHETGDEKFARLPDVVLIDGGRGQVNIVSRALKGFSVKIIGIAKGSHSRTKAKDELILPGVSRPIILPNNSPTKFLLQNIRDEVHRFALAYHTHLRRKRLTS